MSAEPVEMRAMRLLTAVLTVLTAAALAVACGGGDKVSGAGLYAAGTISGFGSVVVNGVRFDTQAVQVRNDDDEPSSLDALSLGMTVEIESGDVVRPADGSATAHAERIAHGSILLGPIGGIDTLAQRLTVLGQTVLLTDATILAGLPGGLSALTLGQVIEVHGLFDKSNGTTTASRIEVKAGTGNFYRLRGVVSQLDTVARTLTVGGQRISYANADPARISAELAQGQSVRLKLDPMPQSDGTWVALQIRSAERSAHEHDGKAVQVEGVISAYTALTDLRVGALPVDASAATFSNGTATDLVVGARVEVAGVVRNGVLQASRIELRKSTTDKQREFEFHGAIETLNVIDKTFVLRGSTVDYGDAGVNFVRGAEADLKNGAQVEVKGKRSGDGTQIVATRIKFE